MMTQCIFCGEFLTDTQNTSLQQIAGFPETTNNCVMFGHSDMRSHSIFKREIPQGDIDYVMSEIGILSSAVHSIGL